MDFQPTTTVATQTTHWDDAADVVILGAGGGGLAAAITAADAGSSVLVLEVMPDILQSGTAICGGVVMGAGTSVQRAAGVSDSIEAFDQYLAAVGGGFEDPDLRRLWAQNAGETIDWLIGLGVEFPVEHLYISGVEREYADVTPPVARGHITSIRSGRMIVETLYRAAESRGVRFLFQTRGTRFITDAHGMIAGVAAVQSERTFTIKARRGVVLATAGFSRNQEFIKNFMPKMLTGGSFGSPWQQGDGILMGQALGAQLVNMWIPQAAAMGVITTPDMTPCMVITIWGSPCLMVSQDAKRHFREDLYYEFMYDKIAEQPGGYVWTIWDQAVTDLGGNRIAVPAFSKDLSVEIEQGWVKTAPSIAALAEITGLEPATLEETVTRYNADMERGEDTEFGKTVGLAPVAKPPFYAARTVPATCDTAGGLKINPATQVLNAFGQPIPRLYATGSTTGGWRGKIYPGSGTAVSFTIAFGRIAGQNVAAEELVNA